MTGVFNIVEDKEIITKDAILIEGFPSVGVISSIASNYLINTLQMEYVGAVYSRFLAPASIVIDGVPYPPFRIYAGKPTCVDGVCEQIIVMTSEFKVPDLFVTSLAETILDWSKAKGITKIISIEGIPTKDAVELESQLVGTGSTARAREFLKKQGVQLMDSGLVVGISGVLLYEAARRGQDVSCVLAHAMDDIPDSRSAAKIIAFVNKVFASIEVDVAPLLNQAEALEAVIKKVRNNTPKKTPEDMMVPIYQ